MKEEYTINDKVRIVICVMILISLITLLIYIFYVSNYSDTIKSIMQKNYGELFGLLNWAFWVIGIGLTIMFIGEIVQKILFPKSEKERKLELMIKKLKDKRNKLNRKEINLKIKLIIRQLRMNEVIEELNNLKVKGGK